MGLFERWLEIEKASGKSVTEILDGVNKACGSKYKHNWPSVMASRQYSLDRLPTNVRRYMMEKVLPAEIALLGIRPSQDQIDAIIDRLT
jgi:hypothetical protein